MTKYLFIIIISLLSILSCGEKKGVGKPVLKNNLFHTGKMHIDSSNLNSELINKKLNSSFSKVKRYDIYLDNSIGSLRAYNDFLILGYNKKGEEELVYYYSQYPDNGGEIWDVKFIKEKNESVLNQFDAKKTFNEDKTKTIFNINNYNILTLNSNLGIIEKVSIINNFNTNSIEKHELLDEFFFNQKNR